MRFRCNFIVLVACLIALTAATFAQETNDPQPEPIAADDIVRTPLLYGPTAEQDIVDLTNILRGSNGLGMLTVNNCLRLAARRHSQDMGQRGYVAHQAPTPAPYGVNFWDRASAAGYTGFPRAENIAAGYSSAQAVYNVWANSPPHLANMLLADVNEIGVGYAEVPGSPYLHYWTMVVGTRTGVSCAATAPPTGLSVTGNTTVYPARPTFNWTYNTSGDPNLIAPTWFRVVVTANGTMKLSQWISAVAACAGNTTCSYTPDAVKLPEGLNPQGVFDLWVAGYSDSGGTVWSGKHTFSVDAGAGLVNMIAPTQGASVNTALVNLTWSNDPKSQWYRIILLGPDGYKFDKWLSSAAVCSGSTCTFVAAPTKQGTYDWWMTAWGPGGRSYGGSYNGYVTRSFSLHVQYPVVSGLTKDNSTAYTRVSWVYDSNASWYQVLITDDTNGAAAHDKWYRADAICYNTTCNVGFIPLVNGAYTLSVRGWGPAHMGNMTSETMSFSHNAPNLAGDARSPANGASVVSGPTLLEWANDEDTLWYQVILNGPNGTVINKWYEGRAICPGMCKLGPVNLASGSYQWTMKGWGPGGTGSPATTSFTVQ